MSRRFQLTYTVVAGALLATPGLAQDAVPSGPGEAPRSELVEAVEIVVSAMGHETPTFLTPASTSTVASREIQRTRLRRTLPDALLDLPSVMVQRTSYGQASPFLRGFTGYQTVMLVDGIRLNNSTFRSGPNQYWSTVDAFTVERLEVTRGAASVLHGSDAVGGTVNAVARRVASFEPGLHAGGRTLLRWASAEDSWISRTEVSGNQDDLGFLVGGTYRTYGDLRSGHPERRQDQTGYRDTDGDLRLDFRQDADVTWTFAVQHVDQDAVPRTHKTEDAVSFHGTDAGSELKRDLDQTRDLVYARRDHRNAGLAFADRTTTTLSWHRQRESQVRDRDTSRRDIQGYTVDTWGLQQQFEKSTRAGYLVYGVEAWLDDVSSFRDDYVDGALDLSRIQGPVADDADYALLAVYAQDEIELGETTVTVGARFTHAAADANRVDDPAVSGGDPATPGNVIDIDDSWNNVVGSVRAVHPLSQRWNVFGGVSQAFRAPNLSDLTRLDDTSGVETPSPDLDPEHFVSTEIGVKHQGADVTFQASYWRTWIRDLIVPSPTGRSIGGTPEVRKDNVGDGWVNGVEVEGRVRLDDAWSVAAAGTWMDGEVEQLDPVLGNVDRPLSRLMPLTGSLTFTYAPPGGGFEAWFSGRAATRQDDLSLKDATDTERIPPDGTPRYAVLSLGASMDLGEHATVSVAVDNVTDTNYRIHGSGVNEPGRNFVLAVDLRF